MGIKLSAHCNVTNCVSSGYPCIESIKSFANLCDEVIVVDGGSTDGSLKKLSKIDKVKVIQGEEWPRDFDWTILGRNLKIGYENCSGDWAFHFDADYIFHEDDVKEFRKQLEKCNQPAVEVAKINFISVNNCLPKGYYSLVANKGYKVITYGIPVNFKGEKSATFLQPIAKSGYDKDSNLPSGTPVNRKSMRIDRINLPIYCYDFIFMTKEQVTEQRVRFDNAVNRYRKRDEKVGQKKAFISFIGRMREREKNSMEIGQRNIKIEKHSKFIRERVRNIKPEQFGHAGWGLL